MALEDEIRAIFYYPLRLELGEHVRQFTAAFHLWKRAAPRTGSLASWREESRGGLLILDLYAQAGRYFLQLRHGEDLWETPATFSDVTQ
jgi:hypothetical protein